MVIYLVNVSLYIGGTLNQTNSTDNTRRIAKRYGCEVIQGGDYCVGRNNGGYSAKAPYLLFLDADCELPEDFIEVNLKAFIKSKKGCGTTTVKPLSKRYFDKTFFWIYDRYSRMIQYISPHCCGGSIWVKRSTFNKIGGFDENIKFAENHDLTRRGKPYGFIILPRHMYTSVRRLDKDGRFKFVFKYIYAGLYRIFYKEINQELFEYDNKRN